MLYLLFLRSPVPRGVAGVITRGIRPNLSGFFTLYGGTARHYCFPGPACADLRLSHRPICIVISSSRSSGIPSIRDPAGERSPS